MAEPVSASGHCHSAIRVADQPAGTWQNVAFSLPFLPEALMMGLRITSCKRYHRRPVHAPRTFLPRADRFHAIYREPVHGGALVTRDAGPGFLTSAGASASGMKCGAESKTDATAEP